MKIENDEGKEIEVFTAEEVAAREKAAGEAVGKTEGEKNAALQAELEKARRVLSEKTDNFKKLHEMTEEEKSKMSAAQIESAKRMEAAETRASALEEEIKKDKTTRSDKAREKALARYSGTDEKVKEKLVENYKLINLPEGDEDEINRKVEAAWNMMGVGKPKVNPLNQSWQGDAPNKGSSENFAESERGKAALKNMGELKF
jgi:hypothetical protein